MVNSINKTEKNPKKQTHHTPNNYFFKVNNWNTRKRSETYSKLQIKTLEQREWRRSGVFIFNVVHISHLFLIFPLLVLNK